MAFASPCHLVLPLHASSSHLRPSARTTPTAARKRSRTRRPTREADDSLNIVLRAQRLARRGRGAHGRACAMLRDHLHEAPADSYAWLALAQMVRSNEAALDIFEEGATHCPESTHLLHAWAVRAGRCGQLDKARHLFLRCLRLDRNDSVVWQAFGQLEERAGDAHLARGMFLTGVQKDPKAVHLWNAWGALERREGDYEKAVSLLRKADALRPNHAPTLQSWALSLEALGDIEGAQKLFDRCLESNPQNVPTMQAAAMFHDRQGDIEGARVLFKRAAKVDPDHTAVWHAWATMERRLGNVGDARNLFEQGLNANPYSAPMLRSWAAMESELGHIDDSDDWHARTPRVRPAVGENLHMLRMLLEQRSNDDVAQVMKWLHRRATDDRAVLSGLAMRGSNDARMLRDAVARRSADDVELFKRWVSERYAADRRIGVYLLNWDIPPARPQEWFTLIEAPGQPLAAADERIFYGDADAARSLDYADGVYYFSEIAERFASRAAVAFALSSLSVALLCAAAGFESNGYVPAGDKVIVAEEASNQEVPLSPPNGVDAYLYQPTIEEGELKSAGGTLLRWRPGGGGTK